jgi:hypothetical protein
MNRRQVHALAHPLARADGDPRLLRAYTVDRKHPTGLLLRTILAVDR